MREIMRANQSILGTLYLVLAASIWGGMYVVSKIVLVFVSPLLLLWLRYVVALVALVVLVWVSRQSWRIRVQDLWLIAGVGLTGYALSVWAQFVGTALTSAQMGAMITSATPAFMVVFARILRKERMTRRKAFAVALATVGVLLIVGIGGMGHSNQWGVLALTLAAITWALMSVLVTGVPKEYSQLVVTMYAIAFATLVITPLSFTQLHEVPSVLSHPLLVGGVLYLGVIATALAFFLWNKGLLMVGASAGGLYFFFQPLVGTLLGWLILGERVDTLFWIGATMILVSAGMTLSSKK